ncbi:hypothetical protein CcCBS67573_g09598 [Chytriomyces confervae]|uniref:Uncharacterized protein n=1 Tax=Chytriomyces confervae TaxID=246404 RepID=A0A507DSM3_9FUNG|nr:hypothetical protein CcCBS67573_g09598 [Chytriomyces confervae]
MYWNPVTQQIMELPEKLYQECDNLMDWRVAGAIQKQRNGCWTYQGHCSGIYQKVAVNDNLYKGNPAVRFPTSLKI